MSDESVGEVNHCPYCGEQLGDGPEGNKVYRCPNHGEIILNVHGLGVPDDG